MRLIDADKMKEYMKDFTGKELMENEEVFEIIDEQPTVKINGNTSDGYHTFDELYHHRAILFAVICNANKNKAWKSKRHSDGTMYDGMFIVGINTPHGDYTYHYDIEPYWNLFDVKTLAFAPEWDGHKPEDIDRLLSLPIFGQWISTKKCLPETSGMYLVTKVPYYISVLPFSVKHKAFNTYDVFISKDKAIPVDYWMPLPEPPKKGETNEL